MSVKSKGQKTGLKPHFSTPHSNTCPEPPSYRGKVLVCLGVGGGRCGGPHPGLPGW